MIFVGAFLMVLRGRTALSTRILSNLPSRSKGTNKVIDRSCIFCYSFACLFTLSLEVPALSPEAFTLFTPSFEGSLEVPSPSLAQLRFQLLLFLTLRQQLVSLPIVTHSFLPRGVLNGTSQPFPFQSLPHSSFALLLNRVEQFLWNQTVPHSFPSPRGWYWYF